MVDKKTLLFSIALNLFFLALCLIYGNLRYAAIDDWFMAGILSGIYGEGYNVHLTFVSAAYGYCLLPLYHLFPKISWYYVGEMASVFISFTVIVYILIKKTGLRWGCLLAMLLLILRANDYYLAVQFTQCAAVLSAAGMLSLVYGLCKMEESRQDTKWGLTAIAIGVVLLWWGSCMRWPAFLMGLPFFAAALLFFAKRLWRVKWLACATLVVALIGAWGLHLFDCSQYSAPDYKRYMDFQGPRSLLGDGLYYNQQAVGEDLEEMGYSSRDYDMLTNWIFYDNQVFSPESIRVVTDVIADHIDELSFRSMPMAVLAQMRHCAWRPAFMAWLLLSLALFAFNPKKSLWGWASMTTAFAMTAYLLYLQRFFYRVETGLWLYAAVLTIPLLKERFRMPRIVFGGAMLVLALATLFSYAATGPQVRHPNSGDVVAVQNEAKDTADYKGLFAFMDSVSDSTVFMAKMNSYMRISRQKGPVYLAEPQGSWNQIISFGFWTPYFPDVEEALHKRGVNNPIKDVVRDNVLVIDESHLVDFLQRHHYEKVKMDTVRNFKGMMVYRYSLDNDSLEVAE